MELVHEKGVTRGIFRIEEDIETIAAMTYVRSKDNELIIDHTEVSSQYQNRGLGKKLIEAAVKYARENKMTIHPLCSFARDIVNRDPSFIDVIRQ